jgi:hypothetical protein
MITKAITSALTMYALAAVIAALVVGLIKLITFVLRRTAAKGTAN